MKKCGLWIVLVLILFLPVQVLAAELPADGRYTVEVTLSGGSGRATLESPAKLLVADGAATATVIWSSPYYEYMRLDGVTYSPVHTGGNSTFEIQVALDENMAVSARTVAMSQPHEIDYILRFDSATLKSLADHGSSLIQLAAGTVAVILILLAGAVLLRKRQRENRIEEE